MMNQECGESVDRNTLTKNHKIIKLLMMSIRNTDKMLGDSMKVRMVAISAS